MAGWFCGGRLWRRGPRAISFKMREVGVFGAVAKPNKESESGEHGQIGQRIVNFMRGIRKLAAGCAGNQKAYCFKVKPVCRIIQRLLKIIAWVKVACWSRSVELNCEKSKGSGKRVSQPFA